LQTAFKRVDPKTGRIEYDPEHKPAVGKTVDFCPMRLGAKSWQPAAFNPKTRMIYIPTSGVMGQPSTFTIDGKQYVEVMSGWGGDARGFRPK
jgi:alcohol dehydrogenase (cytochrome c)